MRLPHVFAQSMQRVFTEPPRKLGLAVSGGVDSMALASLASQWATSTELHAYIVDHKLRRESTDEAHEVAQSLSALGLYPHILTLKSLRGDASKSRMEEYARHARRAVFTEACAAEHISHLVLAHHQNDQIELFIQRLLAGSSWFGLAGMSFTSPMSLVSPVGQRPLTLVRPFLQVPKSELRNWCSETGVPWWEDPTNDDISLTQRNLVRRLYRDGLEPAAVKPENLVPLLNFLETQRLHVGRTADVYVERFREKGLLMHNIQDGTARLKITDDFVQLPLMIISEVLVRIAAVVSPYDEDKIVTRRRKLDRVARFFHETRGQNRQTRRQRLSINVMGVHFQFTKNSVLEMTPEPLRRNQSPVIGVYKVTKSWSNWILVDNRWFMRWKLPNSCHDDAREVRVDILNDEILQRLSQVSQKGVRGVCRRLPVLAWNDTDMSVIGLPTLEPMNCLDVEFQPKVCSF